jgi:hypothetical protein
MSRAPSLVVTAVAFAIGSASAEGLGWFDLSSGVPVELRSLPDNAPAEVSALKDSAPVFGSEPDPLTLTGSDIADVASHGSQLAVMPVSAVPEPASYMTLLAGLSVALFLARRRLD